MSTANTVGKRSSKRRRGCGDSDCRRGNWSGSNIAVMVVGFVLFWPLGLLALYWILNGRDVLAMGRKLSNRKWWPQFKAEEEAAEFTDNAVFNEYQQTQLDRVREIRDEIKARRERFGEFRSEAQRRADEEEFRRFMDGAEA